MEYLTICIFQNSFSILISLLYSNSHLPTQPRHFRFISSYYYSPFVMLYITSYTQFPTTSSYSHPLSSSRMQLISSPSSSSSSSSSSFLKKISHIIGASYIFCFIFGSSSSFFLFIIFFSLQIHARILDWKANFFKNKVEPAYGLNGFSS